MSSWHPANILDPDWQVKDWQAQSLIQRLFVKDSEGRWNKKTLFEFLLALDQPTTHRASAEEEEEENSVVTTDLVSLAEEVDEEEMENFLNLNC